MDKGDNIMFKTGDRVEVVGECKTKGKTGIVHETNLFSDVTVLFDVPTESGKKSQTYMNISSLRKTSRMEKPTGKNVNKNNPKKVAVFLNDCCEYELCWAESLDDALQQVEDDSDGDPDMAPDEVVWDGVKYEIETSLKFTVRE
jgi:hypothetical protein